MFDVAPKSSGPHHSAELCSAELATNYRCTIGSYPRINDLFPGSQTTVGFFEAIYHSSTFAQNLPAEPRARALCCLSALEALKAGSLRSPLENGMVKELRRLTAQDAALAGLVHTAALRLVDEGDKTDQWVGALALGTLPLKTMKPDQAAEAGRALLSLLHDTFHTPNHLAALATTVKLADVLPQDSLAAIKTAAARLKPQYEERLKLIKAGTPAVDSFYPELLQLVNRLEASAV